MNTDPIRGFQQARDRLRNPTLRKNIGTRVVELFKRHIGALEETRPNQKGFPRRHFWAGAVKSTNWRLTPDGVQVVVSQEGFAQRVYRGIIRPVNAKALTIPEAPEAYGKRATVIPDLYFIPIHKGNVVGMLVKRNLKRVNAAIKRIGTGPTYEIGTVYYLLVKQVNQKPDPSVVPTEAQINEAVQKSLDNYLSRQ